MLNKITTSNIFNINIWFSISLCLLLGLRDLANIEINKFIIVMLCLTFFSIANFKQLISMLAFIIPLLCGMPGTYIVPIVICLFYIRWEKSLTALLLTMFFICIELFDSLFYPDIRINEMLQYFSFLCMLFIFIYNKEIKNNCLIQYQACKYYLLGSTFLCITIFISTINTAASNWLYLFANGWFRFGDVQADEFSGMMLKLNANSLAYFACIGVIMSLVYALSIKGKEKYSYVIMAGIHCFIGVLTVSRSFFLITPFCLIITILSMLKNRKQILLISTSIGLVCLFSIIILNNFSEIFAGVLYRFEDDTISTAGGRTELFFKYLDSFANNPRFWLFGTGVIEYKEMTGVYNSMHNALQQLVVCLGIPGSLIFIGGIMKPVIEYVKSKGNKAFFIPFISACLFLQTIQILNPCQLMLPLAVCIFTLRMSQYNFNK